jgi:hypothetical protein
MVKKKRYINDNNNTHMMGFTSELIELLRAAIIEQQRNKSLFVVYKEELNRQPMRAVSQHRSLK